MAEARGTYVDNDGKLPNAPENVVPDSWGEKKEAVLRPPWPWLSGSLASRLAGRFGPFLGCRQTCSHEEVLPGEAG